MPILLGYHLAVCLAETACLAETVGPVGTWDPAGTWRQPHVGVCSVGTLAAVWSLVAASVVDLHPAFDSAVEIFHQNVGF